MKFFFSIAISIATLSILLLTGCNKTVDKKLPVVKGDSIQKLSKKVMMIIVDGAVGAEVDTIAPVYLKSLEDNALYSWSSLANYDADPVTVAQGWSNLLTGVSSAKHKVTGADFTGNNLINYPSVFKRIKDTKPSMRTVAFASSKLLTDNLATDATATFSFNGNDAAVKDAVKAELQTNNPDFVVAEFSAVDVAGQASSYKAASATYSAAVNTTDQYIAEITAAINSRPSAKNEDWLVIITSSKGSNEINDPVAAQKSKFDDSRKNTFFFAYNPRFKGIILENDGSTPYEGAPPLLNNYYGGGTPWVRGEADGGNLYDLTATDDYTISCKVKLPQWNAAYFGYYSDYHTVSYLSCGTTASSDNSGKNGWYFAYTRVWQFVVNLPSGTYSIDADDFIDPADGWKEWHDLTVVLKTSGTAKIISLYTDGNKVNEQTIDNFATVSPQGPLTVGYNAFGDADDLGLVNYHVTDIKFLNTALPDDFIRDNYCKNNPLNGAYAANVVGYWPGIEMAGTPDVKTLPDLSSNQKDMVLSSSTGSDMDIIPDPISVLSANVCPEVSETVYKSLPNSVDVVNNVFSWLGIIVSQDWMLDGKTLLPQYTNL